MYGPEATFATPTLQQAQAYCRQLTKSHYENFTVASWLLPRQLRQPFASVYAYCRWADDLADEVGNQAQSTLLLDWWNSLLDDCYRGRASHPVFVALREAVQQFEIPADPFADLLQAFQQDQQQSRYETIEDLLAYCQRSANPVGRIVLYLGRCHDPETAQLADKICTGLQLANFCQDVARDFRKGRIYLPQMTLRQYDVSEDQLKQATASIGLRNAICQEVDRAKEFLAAGHPLLAKLPKDLRKSVALFQSGGLEVLRLIRCQDYDVLSRRPRVSNLTKLRLICRACFTSF